MAKSKESRAGPSLKLAPEWTPERDPKTGKVLPRGRLWDFTEQIAQSRREGLVFSIETYSIIEAGRANVLSSKNRRDGATVSSRVLTMSDIVGRELFFNAAAPAPADVSSRQMRRKAIGTESKL